MLELFLIVLWFVCLIISAVPSVGIWFFTKVLPKVSSLETLIDYNPFR